MANLKLFNAEVYKDKTPTVLTGGGGHHFYFKYQEGIRNKTKFVEYFDIRSEGGIVIAPPSSHKSGNNYSWLTPWGSINLLPFPQDIFLFLQKLYGAQDKVQNWERIFNDNTTDGSRNSTATAVCGKLLLGLKKEDFETIAWPLLKSWNTTHCSPPDDTTILRSTFESICGKEIARREQKIEIGEPILEKNITEGIVSVTIPIQDGAVNFIFENIEEVGHELMTDVSCSLEKPGIPHLTFRKTLNLRSNSTTRDFVSDLNKTYDDKSIKWALVMNKASLALQEHLESIASEVDFTDAQETSAQWLLEPLVQAEGANIVFGKGATGKTFLTMRLVLSLCLGVEFMGELPTKTMNILWLDYESSLGSWTFRLNKLMRGLEFDPLLLKGKLFYENARGTALLELVKKIKRIIKRRDIELLVVDSIVPACGGKAEESSSTTLFFSALAKIGLTSILIGHETKADNTSSTFGSIMFTNRARNIWNVQKSQEMDSSISDVGLYHRKVNDAPIYSARSAHLYFDNINKSLVITKGNLDHIPKKEQTIYQLIYRSLREKESTSKELQKLYKDFYDEGTISNFLTKERIRGKIERNENGSWYIIEKREIVDLEF